MGRPKEHGEQMRERLLDVAAHLLATEGAGALSVRRLSSEVGTTTRAIYSIFGSKDGLLCAMYRRVAQVFVDRHRAVNAADDPVEELLDLALAYRQAALDEPNLYGLLFERAVPGFCPTIEDVEFAKRGFYQVRDVVQRGVEAQRFVRTDVWGITHELWAVVHGLASLELRGHLGDDAAATTTWRKAIRTFTAGLMCADQSLAGAVAASSG